MAKNGVLTIPEIIDLLGGNIPAAKICGFDKNLSARGGDMRQRASIHVRYWPAILRYAKKSGLAQITPISMIEAHVGFRLSL